MPQNVIVSNFGLVQFMRYPRGDAGPNYKEGNDSIVLYPDSSADGVISSEAGVRNPADAEAVRCVYNAPFSVYSDAGDIARAFSDFIEGFEEK